MNIVHKNLIERFSAPLKEFYSRRIIFWLDEDNDFTELIDEIEIDNVKIVKLTGSNNFAVKHLLTYEDTESNYLVYNPLSYSNLEDNWLLDIQLYSEEFLADDISIKMDELRINKNPEMRKTTKLYKKFLDSEQRRSNLKSLGKDYNKPYDLHKDIIGILCGLKNPTFKDIIIKVLSDDLEIENNKSLINIEKFGNIDLFWEIINKHTGFHINQENNSLLDFTTTIFITALSQNLSEQSLNGIERYISDTSKAFCYDLVHEWISRRDNKVLDIAKVVEDELNLYNRFNTFDMNTLVNIDIFPCIDEIILNKCFSNISEKIFKSNDILEINDKRRTSAWFYLTEYYFDCLYYIAKMEAFYQRFINGFHIVEAFKITELYDKELYKMDTYYRKFHFYFLKIQQSGISNLSDNLKNCLDYIESLYQNWFLRNLNDSWYNSINKDLEELGFIHNIGQQKTFYSYKVNSKEFKNSKLFIIISDAFRYEVAKELVAKLISDTNGEANITPMQSIFPSVTKCGMSALLPHKELSLSSKNEVLIDGKSTNGIENRQAILQSKNKNSIAIRYKDLLDKKGRERRDYVKGMEIIYIYHDIIDAIGDKLATENRVFEACDTAINEICGIVKTITGDMNGTNILITSDHGFLYTNTPLLESQKISKDTIDGEIYEIGRRYALTSLKTNSEYLAKIKLSNFYKDTDMVGYAPKDITRIKLAGGGSNFVHGGITIQEMIIPYIQYKHIRHNSKRFKEIQNVELELLDSNRKLSNFSFNIEFLQTQAVADKMIASTYSIYFADEDNILISDTKTVIADKTSKERSERKHKAKFNLKQMKFEKNKKYYLVITNNIDIPQKIEYQIDIAFNINFDD